MLQDLKTVIVILQTAWTKTVLSQTAPIHASKALALILKDQHVWKFNYCLTNNGSISFQPKQLF